MELTAPPHLLILYASETGCAEDVARRCARESRRRHFRTRLASTDEYDLKSLLNERLVLFVCSTTGQGDEPEAMRHFWKYLKRKTLPAGILSELEFAVFGLGDSSYEKFNYPAKKLFNRFVQLGSKPLVPRGDGDDQHYLGVDGTLDPWLSNLWSTVLNKYPMPLGMEIVSDDILPEPMYHVTISKGQPTVRVDPEDDTFTDERPGFYPAPVLLNERITSPYHFQDVRHMELEIGEQKYQPGDIATVQPRNLPNDVDELISFLGWTEVADFPLSVTTSNPDIIVPPVYARPRQEAWTLRRLLTHRLSIISSPRRYFFKLNSFFAGNDLEREKLLEFHSAEGQDELQDYCYRQKRTCLEVFRDFPNTRPPPEYVFDLFPELKPRQFSISSSMKEVGARLALTVAIVRYKSKIQDIREGVCTRWLKELTVHGEACHGPGPKIPSIVPLRITKGSMRVTNDLSQFVILVAPGTGIAPMRSFLQDRLPSISSPSSLSAPPFEFSQIESISHQPTTALFFGFRHPSHDYYYRHELQTWEKHGCLKLLTAPSRFKKEKVFYVQHRIREEGAWLWTWLEKGAMIRVCGNANRMPEDVRAAFRDVISSEGALSQVDAETYLQSLRNNGRYQEECWF